MLSALPAALAAAALLPAGAHASERIVWSQYSEDFEAMAVVSAKPDGSDARRLTGLRPGIKDYDPKLSPDGRRIVFERDRPDGSAALVVMRADGSGQRVLDTGCTDPCAADAAPTWTRDGGRIAYTRVEGPFDRPNESAASAVLWTVRPDGSGRRRLSQKAIDGRFEDYGAHFAPGYVQFLRTDDVTGHSALFTMHPDGGHVRQLTPWRLDADLNDLSSGRVVFETYGHGGRAQDVAIVPVDCGSLSACAKRIRYVTRNPAHGRVNSTNPTWSPAGTRIAMSEWIEPSSDDAADGTLAGIYTLAPDGGAKRRISVLNRWSLRPDWGPALR